jgi:hypothetical protein
MTTPTSNVPTLPLGEARSLVAAAQTRLDRIRSRAAELAIRAAARVSAATAHDRALAVALVEDDREAVARLTDEAVRVAGPATAMSPSEARRALAALQGLEAEVVAELHDARAILRRAVAAALQEELATQVAQYDQVARQMQEAWARVTVLFETLAGMTGRSEAPPSWHHLAIPRAQADRSPMSRLAYPATGELLTGVVYNGARKAVLAALQDRGVEPGDIGGAR